MTLSSTITIIGIRAILISLALRYGGKLINSYKPKNKLLKNFWKKDMKLRTEAIKYAWWIGLTYFLIHVVIVLILQYY
tara:strand:- start:383 stop:616 length:234 start_codon:yes stop_codon:yes gene_type:complete